MELVICSVPVNVGSQSILNGLLDSGSMACTLSMEGESKLLANGVLPHLSVILGNVVLVGCGGLTIQPKCTYDLEVEVYGFKFIVLTLLVKSLDVHESQSHCSI